MSVRAEAVAAYHQAGSLRKAVDVLRGRGITVSKSALAEWVRLHEEPQTAAGTLDLPASQSIPYADRADATQAPEDAEPGHEARIGPRGEVSTNGGVYDATIDMPPSLTIADRIREDPRYLAAFRRYVDAIVNDVHPDQALRAAQQVDDDFGMADHERDTIHEAAGRLREQGDPIWLAEDDSDPPEDVTDDWLPDAAAVAALGAAVLALKSDAYLMAINDNLTAFGHAPVSAITDPAVLASLASDADAAAAGIADTYRADLLSAARSIWRGLDPLQRTPQALADGLRDWADGRTDYKAEQVMAAESNAAYNDAAFAFQQYNDPSGDWWGYVTPDECICDGCLSLVQMGTQPADVMNMLDLPLHMGCWHRVEWQLGPDGGTITSPVWAAQADEGDVVGFAEGEVELGQRDPAHNHPTDWPHPVVAFDLHRTLTPWHHFPLVEPPFPGVKAALDRLAAEGCCLHIATAGLYVGGENDADIQAARHAQVVAWCQQHGLPIDFVTAKHPGDVYYDDRMIPVIRGAQDWPGDIEPRIRAALAERFDLVDGRWVRKDTPKTGTPIDEPPDDVPPDSPRGNDLGTVNVDMHRTLSSASSSKREGDPVPGVVDLMRALYDMGYTVQVSCAGWNPATHSATQSADRLDSIRQWLRENGVAYDRVITKDHADLYVDDDGITPTDSAVNDLGAILRRLG